MSHLKEVCRYCGAIIMECRGSGPAEVRYGVCDKCASGPKKQVVKEKVLLDVPFMKAKELEKVSKQVRKEMAEKEKV